MKVNELGEFGVIHQLTEAIKAGRGGPDNATPFDIELTVDIGDDTAAWRTGGVTELYTTDTVVEEVHFTRATTPWYDLGWKLMAANVSDIAAMGGTSLYALVTLGLPPDTEVEDLSALYKGMVELGNRYGVSIVGGDIVRCPITFVTVALTGVTKNPPMIRSNALPGQQVAVTGYVGSSAGGLEILLKSSASQSDTANTTDAVTYLIASHRRPEPCIDQGRTLAERGVATAMDISDGLVDDLSKLCSASRVSAFIEADKVPVHPALTEVFPDRALQMALGGGEDYQLIFVATEKLMTEVLPELPPPARIIGRITAGEPGSVSVVDSRTGQPMDIMLGGWDHLKGKETGNAG